MIIAFSGMRPNKLNNEYDLYGPITTFLENKVTDFIINKNPERTIVGGALGFDTLAALISIKLNIPFTLAIPCRNQEKVWPQKSQQLYRKIAENPLCTKYLVTDKPYSAELMNIRNKWMVDNSDEVIACWNGSSGGTSNCVNYAYSVKKPVTIIDPTNELRMLELSNRF